MSRSSMAAHLLVVLIALNIGGLSPPRATAAEDFRKLNLELPPPSPPEKASGAAHDLTQKFCTGLQTTMDELNWNLCYNELIPYAESFKDNQVKATQVATIILITKIQALSGEVSTVIQKGIRDQNINDCMPFFKIGSTYSESTNSTLYALERLTTTAEGKRNKEDLETVHKWTKNLETQYNMTTSKCKLGDLFKYGDTIPTVWVIDTVTTTAINLLNAIKP